MDARGEDRSNAIPAVNVQWVRAEGGASNKHRLQSFTARESRLHIAGSVGFTVIPNIELFERYIHPDPLSGLPAFHPLRSASASRGCLSGRRVTAARTLPLDRRLPTSKT